MARPDRDGRSPAILILLAPMTSVMGGDCERFFGVEYRRKGGR